VIGHLELAIGTLTSYASWAWLKKSAVKSDFSQMHPTRSRFDYERRAFRSDRLDFWFWMKPFSGCWFLLYLC